MNFNEWLTIKEAIIRAIRRAFNETFLEADGIDTLRATKVSVNRELQRMLGHNLDYFGICIEEAARHVRGQDVLDLATQVATTIMHELSDPQGELSQRFAQAADSPDHVGRLFRVATRMRTLRDADFYTQRRRKKAGHGTVNIGALADPEADEPEAVYGHAPTSQIDADRQLGSLKRYVEEELQKMLDEAPARQKGKLSKAILVARERLRYAPQMVPMKDLLDIFDGQGDMPKISKAAMSGILSIIEDAVRRVAERIDSDTLRQGVSTGGKWDKKAGG